MGDIFKRWRNKKHIKAIKAMPCACGCGRRPCDPHHRIGDGDGTTGGTNPDSEAMPLYRTCHDEFHAGRKAFEERVGKTQWEMLARTLAYLKEQE